MGSHEILVDVRDSYDAAEDNEISFKEGERITGIEKVDTDWWQGRAGGKEGLFPGRSLRGVLVEYTLIV
jgi:hypothetical protein